MKKEQVIDQKLSQLADSPLLSDTPASFDKSTQATSKQDVVGSNPTGRTISLSIQRFV